MERFVVALGVFLAAHMVPTMPPVRRFLTHRLGERPYLALYTVLSLGLLVWLLWEAASAPVVPLWTAAPWTAWIPVLLMGPAFVLIAAGLLEPNPLSVSLGGSDFDPARPGIVALLRHPVLWGFGLWSLSHSPINGALVHVILFGGFGLFSFAGMALVDAKRKRSMGLEAWRALDQSRHGGRMLTRRVMIGAAIGLGLYLVFLLHAHRAWIGVDPLAMLG